MTSAEKLCRKMGKMWSGGLLMHHYRHLRLFVIMSVLTIMRTSFNVQSRISLHNELFMKYT